MTFKQNLERYYKISPHFHYKIQHIFFCTNRINDFAQKLG